jgi:hypothetical protein
MSEAATHILEQLDGRKFGEPMKRALRRVLEGESYRHAAAAEGIDHSDVHRSAKSVPGLIEAHLAAWRDGWSEAFPAVWRRHLKRIEPGSGSAKAS